MPPGWFDSHWTTPGGFAHARGSRSGLNSRDIAAAIGDHLGLPTVSIAPEDAEAHFGWIARFFAMDITASSARTRELLGWTPTGPRLYEDISAGAYTPRQCPPLPERTRNDTATNLVGTLPSAVAALDQTLRLFNTAPTSFFSQPGQFTCPLGDLATASIVATTSGAVSSGGLARGAGSWRGSGRGSRR